MIGRFLTKVLMARNWDVTVTTRQASPRCKCRPRRIEMDLLEVANAGKADIPDNDVTFLCAATTGFAECNNQPEISELINVTANVVLAKKLAESGGRCVFLSTSAVFNGNSALRPSADIPDGGTTYGGQKAKAERVLSETDERLAIVRLAKVLDPSYGLICDWIGELKAGRPIAPFHDLVMAPVSLKIAVKLLCDLAESTERGIFQLSAQRDVTYAEIARHIARQLHVSPRLVAPTSAMDAGLEPDVVPAHTTLDSRRSLMLMNGSPIEPLQVVDKVFGLTGART